MTLSPNLEERFFRENKEMACRRRSLLLVSLALFLRRCRRCQQENKKQKRRFWVRKIFTEKRKERGEWGNLIRELSNDYREYYYMYLRMSPERFEHLFNFVGPLIAKQDRNYRCCYASLFSRRLFITSIESQFSSWHIYCFRDINRGM